MTQEYSGARSKNAKNNRQTFKQSALIQGAKDKALSCFLFFFLFTVLFAIISIISPTILKLFIGLVLFSSYHLFARIHTRVPILLFLLCRYAEAEPFETKIDVFTQMQSSTDNKENFNIARGLHGLQMEECYVRL